MSLDPEIEERVKKLEEKYAAMGQDLTSYLDGLLYADYLTYWNYIRLDALLSLQSPITPLKDEMVFIIYHQITELYFKLSLHEYEQLKEKGEAGELTADFFAARVKRINSYFGALTRSFDIMVDGMEPKQFAKFRMSLLPASGFQSGQYRKIEICSTDFVRLVAQNKREGFERQGGKASFEEMFEHLYWKQGATELATGKKTLTLRQFEEKYADELIRLADSYRNYNLWALFSSLSEADKQHEALRKQLRELDLNVNVNWPLVHYKSAVRYLQKNPEDIAATGGTNWQKYLPPRFQKRIFYPGLWSQQEQDEWGKGWVETEVFGK